MRPAPSPGAPPSLSVLDPLIERLPSGMVSTHHGELAGRARDRWALAMLQEAAGRPVAPPLAVVFPTETEHVVAVLRWASEAGVPVVPRGEGSGRSGGAVAARGGVVLDLSHMDRVLEVDEVSQAVRVQAGIRGSSLETALARRGLTSGQLPVSLGISTLGGWVATGAAGMAEAGFGGIEDAILGLEAVLAGGEVLRLPAVPRSSTGPDLRRLFVGSEGRLGVVTEVTLSVARATALVWDALRPNSFESGLALVREVVQRPYRPVVLRLFDEARAAEVFGSGTRGGPVAVVGFDRSAPAVEAERSELGRLARDHGARPLPADLAERWWDRRHEAVDRYEEVMGPERTLGRGVVADTVEVAAVWRRLPRLYEAVGGILSDHARSVGCVVGHTHRSGASLLFPFLIRARDDRAAEEAYATAWARALRATREVGGTVSYHHGVGLHKREALGEELGEVGVSALRRLFAALDPEGRLNPGKVLPPESTGAPEPSPTG